jgi:uncharacterized protein (DUF305 family)
MTPSSALVTSCGGTSGSMTGHEGMSSSAPAASTQSAAFNDADAMFAQSMVAHHNGAIEMARTEQANGSNPQAKEPAKTIETAQQAEVAQLQKILDRL